MSNTLPVVRVSTHTAILQAGVSGTRLKLYFEYGLSIDGPFTSTPQANDLRINEGKGTFLHGVGGLEPDKNYYYRAYTTDEAGSGRVNGPFLEFRTKTGLPIFGDPTITNIQTRSMTFNSSINGVDE